VGLLGLTTPASAPVVRDFPQDSSASPGARMIDKPDVENQNSLNHTFAASGVAVTAMTPPGEYFNEILNRLGLQPLHVDVMSPRQRASPD
jgi:hypothetical protein